MKQLFLLLFFAVNYVGASAQTIMGRQNVDQYPIDNFGGQTYGLTWLPQTYNNTARRYPLIIFLHGAGETGTSASSLSKLYTASPRSISGRIADGWNAVAVNPLTGVQDSFIVVSPQAASWSYNYTELKYILPNILSRYRVDTSRIYLTGLSAGGGGTFSTFGSRDANFIKQFAAMVTASSAGTNASNGYTADQVEAGIRFGSSNGVRLWTIAGDQDYLFSTDVRYHDSSNMLNPAPPNKLTVIVGVGHSTWGNAYDPAFRPTINYYGNSGTCANGCNNGGIPVAPNANGSSVMGSGVTQDSLNIYEWLLLSQRSFAPSTSPTAYAGNDQTITQPSSSVTLNGSGTPGSGYSVSSYSWAKTAGPAQFTIVSPTQAQTVINNLATGIYQFELTVTNSGGTTAKDYVVVTVNAANQAPVANAGTDKSITLPVNTVTLTGSGTDPDGNIASYQWAKITGPATFAIASSAAAQTAVNNLVQGTYQFVLTVTDNNGAAAKDTISVSVNAATNIPPTANAGYDQTVTLPVNTVTFTGSGTDPDGTIASYQWSKISGPLSFSIALPGAAQTLVSNLLLGTYQFVLTVTDNNGATAKDTVNVSVNAAVQINLPPTINAGSDQAITLPANAVTFTGSGTDADGTIASYQWTKLSGPSQFTISSPTASQTTVNNLIQGSYQFVLTATDNLGATGKDTVSVSVSAGAQTGGICGGKSYTVLPTGDGGYYNALNLQPGDTLFLDAQYTYYYVYLANRHGTPSCPIVIMNKGGQVKIQGGDLSQISLYDCSYIKVLGTGSSDTYGFRIRPYPADSLINGSFAFSITGRSKNIEVSNLHISNAGTGMNIKEDGGCDPLYNYPNWIMDSINIHDNKIVKTWNQGMYIGNTSPDNGPASYSPRPVDCNGTTFYPRPPRMGNIKVYNNFVDSTGRAGIQLASASTGISEIYNNTVKHSGMAGDDAQGAGIILGSYTKAYIHDNTITNTYAWGLASSGGSGTNIPLRFENNTIDSSGYLNSWTLWTQGKSAIRISTEPIIANTLTWPYSIFLATKPTLDVDSTQFIVKSNSLGIRKHPSGGIGLADYVGTFQKSGNYICNNINSYGGSPNVVIEEVTPIFYSSNCANSQNWPPVAYAGNDQTITLPTSVVTFAGSGIDPDGTISSYQWTKIAGPATFTIASPATAQTAVNSLAQGTYQFVLTVTDNNGATGKDTVLVVVNPAVSVNQPPVANAGTDKSITLPVNTVTLAGLGTDPDGTIASYQWTKIAGPATFTIASPTAAQTSINNLVIQGTYQFVLTVTDNNGATGKDTVLVVVNPAVSANQPPVANAGTDQTITLPTSVVTFAGSGIDPDGTIASYQWTKIAGPATFTIASPATAQTAVNSLVQGTYQFVLTVTDNNGATGKDTILVVVNPAVSVNQPPVANAGTDQTITLPTSVVTFAGSGIDPDGTITSYQWTKIAGPATFIIASPTAAQTSINNLVIQGTYQFVLTVTDNNGATGKDTVLVTVNPAVSVNNQPPVANAGTDKSITLPVNTVTLTGSGTDADGTISSYQWTKIAGPATFTIASPATAQTAVNSLVQGTYQFVLTVTDNNGATGKDTVLVTVNPAVSVNNQAPVANTGTDKSITLPVNTVTLTGSGTDVDGTITSYQWTKIAGPATFTIASPTAAQTSINNLAIQGTYQFVLTVTDNNGATGKDTVLVTVNPAAVSVNNQPPVANAGIDKSITLPVNTVTLTGSGTDVDGTITSYQWAKIAGPATFTIASPAAAQTAVNNLEEGEYIFELVVIDNQGAVGKDTILVTVKTADSKKSELTSVYPNPAVTTINIKISNPANVNKALIKIYSSVGVLAYQTEIVLSQQVTIFTVDVSKFTKGTYFIQLGQKQNGKNEVLTFMKL